VLRSRDLRARPAAPNASAMTSIFIATPCKADQAKVLHVSWCPTEPIVAVATANGQVSFCDEEGASHEGWVIERRVNAGCLAWQTKNRVIAVGWEDGQISIHAFSGGRLDMVYSNDKDHARASLRLLMWNPASSRLVSGDSNGLVRVWKADARGAVAPYKYYPKKSSITAGVFSFSSLPQGSGKSYLYGKAFSPAFFFGTEEGKVFYADDLGHSTEVQALSSAVETMLYYEERSRLVIFTRGLMLAQLQVGDDGRVVPLMQMKVIFGGQPDERSARQVVWAGPGLIAAATGENMIRFWDLAEEENYVLSILNVRGVAKSDRALCLAFNPYQRYLAAGTKEGKTLLWHYSRPYLAGGKTGSTAEDWSSLPHVSVGSSPLHHIAWATGKGVLCAAGPSTCSVLRGEVLHRRMCGTVVAMQLAGNLIRIERFEGSEYIITTDIHIRGLCLSSTQLAVWSGSRAQVFELRDSDAVKDPPFPTSAKAMVFWEGYIYQAVGSAVEKCNLQGKPTTGGRISFTEGEGDPMLLDVNHRFLAVATSLGHIKLFDLDRKDPRQIGSSGRFVDEETGKPLGLMRSIACNSAGNKVSILSDKVVGALGILEPDSRLFVYNADRDLVDSFELGGEKNTRAPTGHFWDSVDPKLLAVETRLRATGTESVSDDPLETREAETAPMSPSNHFKTDALDQLEKMKKSGRIPSESQVEVTTLFVTPDYGIQMQGAIPLERPLASLVGIRVPRLFFATSDDARDADMRGAKVVVVGARRSASDARAAEAKSPRGDPAEDKPERGDARFVGGPFLESRVLNDFAGLEDVDEDTKKALLDFSYYLTIQNMDEAHRAVKLIKNPSVWENMARMCVKTKRIDVAEVCLGNMGVARGAAAVRLAKKEPELEARVAAVAVQLGLYHDADRLYRECKRFDLLNQLYRASGLWDRALEVATEEDRIHLKTTHHQFAKHLEDVGDISSAVKHFEHADTHRTQVPRMLSDRKRLTDLEEYIARSSDPELLKWWAGYCEAHGQFDKARHFYYRAQDHFSLIRIACVNGETARAKQIIEESGDASAAYFLARYLEGHNEIQEAINYYAVSKCYNHAIRLARNFGLDGELMSFALKASEPLMIDCAQHFESKGDLEKAVQLYQKGGDIPKALDLCFRAGGQGRSSMFDVLQTIAGELDENTNPQTVARCAEFFMEHGQFEKAVQLFVTGKRYIRAIDLAVQHKVKITDEMAEGMTPPKNAKAPSGQAASLHLGESKSDMDEVPGDFRVEVLRALARACKKQGSFQLACKKFTQAGDRVKAMKCLLKSGDTKNITYYATVSRNPEIYILAANYLQSLDWQNDPDTMKNIVVFYTKAKAFEQLSSFFDAYAQMEIDEYRDYEKALNALQKASEYISKSRSGDRERQQAQFQQRIYHIQQFVTARNAAKDDASSMVRICHALLEQPNVEAAIRVGDCYALLVEFYYGQANYEASYKLIESMRSRHIVLHPYLEQDMVEDIHRRVGASMTQDRPGEDAPEDEDVAEELDEELDEIESEGEMQYGSRK